MSEKTKKALDELRRLRDEIRVKLDLAGKESKRLWEDLEPQLSQVEDKLLGGGEKVADVSKTVAEEFASAFKRIRDRVSQPSGEDAEAEGGEGASADAEGATDAELVEDEAEKPETD